MLTTTNGTLKPEDAFFIDGKVTKRSIKDKSLKFKTVTDIYTDTAAVLNCGKSTNLKASVFRQFIKGQKVNVYETKAADGYTWVGAIKDGLR